MNNQSLLKVHEWMAVTAILTVMVLLTAFNLLKQKNTSSFPFSEASVYMQNRVEVIVKGAVVYPGVYTLPKKIILKELLDIAELTREADLRRYNLQKTLQQGRVLNVPKRPLISVQVTGAVPTTQVLHVPQGTRVEELVERLVLNEDADLKVFKKKRRLKDGDVIQVPKKKI